MVPMLLKRNFSVVQAQTPQHANHVKAELRCDNGGG